MLEYVAYALLGLVMIGCLLYVTMSHEVEAPPESKRPDPKQYVGRFVDRAVRS